MTAVTALRGDEVHDLQQGSRGGTLHENAVDTVRGGMKTA